MLNISRPVEQLQPVRPELEPAPFGWLVPLLLFLRRRRLPIALLTLALMALAGVATQFMTPTYTAAALISVEPRRANPFRQQPIATDNSFENTFIESQVEIMQAEATTRAVVRRMNLVDHPLFNQEPGTFTQIRREVSGFVKGLLGAAPPAAEGEPDREGGAARALGNMVAIRRVGQTSIIGLRATTTDADFSAALANGYAEAFIELQLGTISTNTRRAGAWLEERLQALRNQAVEADQAVQRYKADNRIVSTNLGLMSEQQLGELNTQLAQARLSAGAADSRLTRIDSLLENDTAVADGTVTETLQNAVIVRLRQQYLDASRREAEWSQRYGRNHTAAVNLRNEMAEIRRAVRDELGRIAQTYRSEAAVARSNVQALETRLGELVDETARSNSGQIMLRSLQSNADTYKTIYENFLQRYTQAMQDESFPIPDARIAGPASPPMNTSSPKLSINLAIAMILGLALGVGGSFLWELLDRSIRTPARLQAVTGVRPLGALARVTQRAVQQAARRAGGAAQPADPNTRTLATTPSLLRHAVMDPMSPFAEVVRGVQVRVLQQRQNGRDMKVVATVSTLRGEGATTLAANLAQTLAASGHLTLLVDADMRSLDLSRRLSAGGAPGLFEVMAGEAALNDTLWRDPQTGMRFLPAGRHGPIPHAAALLASRRARDLIDGLRGTYDYVVMDLPPLAAATDAHAAADLVEGFVLAVEWGRTRDDVLVEALHRFDAGDTHLLGAVLNKTNLRELPRWTGTPQALAPWTAPAVPRGA